MNNYNSYQKSVKESGGYIIDYLECLDKKQKIIDALTKDYKVKA